jgi:hypothetical protein
MKLKTEKWGKKSIKQRAGSVTSNELRILAVSINDY